MPAYNTLVPPPSILPGDVVTVFNAETPVAGTASQQIALTPVAGADGEVCNVFGKFAADPGVFEVDIQGANVDADAQYATLPSGNISTADATTFAFTYNVRMSGARFARAVIKTRTNAVALSLNFGR